MYNIKTSIDNSDPRRPKPTNSKGARLEEERTAQIMHENAILLGKLARILTRDSAVPTSEPTAKMGKHDAYRRRVREQVDHDNQVLLRKLRDMKSSFDIEKFEADARERATFLSRMQAPLHPTMAPGGPRPRRRQRPFTAGDAARRQADMRILPLPVPILASSAASTLVRPSTTAGRPARPAPQSTGLLTGESDVSSLMQGLIVSEELARRVDAEAP